MTIVFRLAYSLVVAILLVLCVILGTRTVYDEPDAPSYPGLPAPFRDKAPIPPSEELPFCEPDGRCFKAGRELTPEDEAGLSEEERDYINELREFYRRQSQYENDRADYHRNVFIGAMLLGVAAVAAGIYLFRRVEALPLGLLMGGFGVVIFAWAQAADDFDEIGAAPLFAVVAVALAVVLAVGYRVLGLRDHPAQDGGQER